MVYACGPEGDAARAARELADAHGRACEVSVERVMGCGLGGCYSCVVPMRGDDGGASHHVALVHRGPGASTAHRIVWD